MSIEETAARFATARSRTVLLPYASEYSPADIMFLNKITIELTSTVRPGRPVAPALDRPPAARRPVTHMTAQPH